MDTEAQLYRHAVDKPGDAGELVDAIELKLAPRADQSFKFDLSDPGLAPYEVRLTVKDALDVDNRAFTVVGTTRKAQVLVITPGNRYLVDTLKTPSAIEHADITIVTPEEAKGEAMVRDIKGGRYDLVIYDGVKPDAPPEANTLYFGQFPPGPAYAKPKDVQRPVVLDWDIAHPMMQYIRDMSLVAIASARVVELPAGAKSLIDSNAGSLAFVAPREGFTDAVVTFPLMEGTMPNTTWFRYISFPLFILNSIQSLGNVREGAGEEVAEPGNPVALHAETINREITVTSADRPRRNASRARRRGLRLQPRREGRPLPRTLGARRAGCRSPSTSSTSARATWPRADWSPTGPPRARPNRTRSRSAITPSPAPRSPPRSRRTSGGGSRSWSSACCWSSGMFTIDGFIFD